MRNPETVPAAPSGAVGVIDAAQPRGRASADRPGTAPAWPAGLPALPLRPQACLGVLLGCELLLVLAHLVTSLGPPALQRLLPLFDLDAERNIPTWFSTAQLCAVALLCIACARVESLVATFAWPDRLAWLMLAALFFGLSLEELVGLHEMVSSHATWVPVLDRLFGDAAPRMRDLFGRGYRYSWIVFYAPLIALATAMLLRFAWTRFRAHPGVRRVMLTAVGMFVLVIVAETLSKSQRGHPVVVQTLVVIEESLEMVGASVFAFGFLLYLERLLTAFVARRAGANSSGT